jgi:Icc-related predicted phosphoesterase
MKILHISDTHGFHQEIDGLPSADVIVHSGDVSSKYGNYEEIKGFLDWFSSLDYKYKILVPGNHDFFFEDEMGNNGLINSIAPGVHILLSESIIIEGVKFYGSPFTPWFHEWAFNLYNHELAAEWAKIPDDTDVLITHGPANGTLDFSGQNAPHIGCTYLKHRLHNLPTLKAHLFGHAHQGYGFNEDRYLSLNSSLLDEKYRLVNKPQIFRINESKTSLLEGWV